MGGGIVGGGVQSGGLTPLCGPPKEPHCEGVHASLRAWGSCGNATALITVMMVWAGRGAEPEASPALDFVAADRSSGPPFVCGPPSGCQALATVNTVCVDVCVSTVPDGCREAAARPECYPLASCHFVDGSTAREEPGFRADPCWLMARRFGGVLLLCTLPSAAHACRCHCALHTVHVHAAPSSW